MPWIYAIVGLLIGIVVGIIITRLTTPQYKSQKSLHNELQHANYELEQQRQEFADHLSQSADLLDTLGKDYTKIYQHMAKTSAELLAHLPEQDNPFDKLVSQEKPDNTDKNTSEDDSLPPKDYASGATGLLKGEEKQFLDSSEVIKNQAS
ncbi:Z-ring associated protein ZapG [Vibrio palustris]|uniref:Z-ring associated protein G n=1 Tax=Vibrio palustris TaxID=1918946 RepID=A0A1R4AZL8_9VIBR|nr:Z-ring associated protein ZapG [Vibrio palustris]SJL82112.1 Inner membrane protein YhcB [Vibrio palustris]